ncbi:MAG: phosphoglycerate kinase [Fidelibacterota bacterium]
MGKLTVDDINYRGKRVLVRVDFNVPLDEGLSVADDYRIKSALPTINKLISDGGRVILMSHLGRPKGKRVERLSLHPVKKRLEQLLGRGVVFTDECIGEETKSRAFDLADGDVMLIENLRFYLGEETNDRKFSKELAELGELYVNDAFGTAHRAHASNVGVTEFFDIRAAGYLMRRELQFLREELSSPGKPFSVLLGGAKVSGKIDIVENLIGKMDNLVVGGGMAFTFLKAKGINTGRSLIEEGKIGLAAEILDKLDRRGIPIYLPLDFIAAKECKEGVSFDTFKIADLPEDMMGLDIGPDTIEIFKDVISKSKTVLWNGPMGVFEIDLFSRGTERIANLLSELTDRGVLTVAGGGDTASALGKLGLRESFSHVSTGGGSSLELLAGKRLPAVEALSDRL